MDSMQTWIDRLTERLFPIFLRLEPLLHRLAQYIQKGFATLWRFLKFLYSIDLPFTPLQGIVILYVIFGLAYLWATPIFEASDELWHFGMVEHIARTGELPVQDPDSDEITPYRQEGSQPPLYYMIASVLVSPFDLDDVDSYRSANPHVIAGNAAAFGNKNLVIHETPHPALEGVPLAVYVVRLFSLALGVVTIIAVYHSALLISPKRPIVATLAAALVAFNPMFLFISASVNNDVLVTALNSIVIYLLLRMVREGFDVRRSLALAILVALAALSKLGGLVLVPVVGIAALYTARKKQDQRGFWLLVVLGIGIGLLLTGWWFARNIGLYGELFGTSTMAAVAGERTGDFNLGVLLSEFQGFRISYWGVFGAFNIQASDLFYVLMDLGLVLAIVGLVFLALQLYAIRDFAYARFELINVGFLWLVAFIGTAAVIVWTSQTFASQGRLLFPFIGAISPLLAVGLVEIIWWILFSLRPPNLQFVRAGDAVPENLLSEGVLWPVRILIVIAFFAPFVTIAPQYAPPAPLDELPKEVIPITNMFFGDVELVGYRAQDSRHAPGEAVELTLYWHVLEQSEQDNSLFVALLSPGFEEVGKIDTYPGAGRLSTSRWEAGKIYPDTYQVRLRSDAAARYPHYPLRVQVGWYTLEDGDVLTRTEILPLDENGDERATLLLNAGAVVSGPVPVPTTGYSRPVDNIPSFQGVITLSAFNFDEENSELVLQWQSNGTVDDDFTVFAHIVDENGELVAQKDIQPDLPTHYWRWGETYRTYHVFEHDLESIDPDQYTFLVGWYLNDGVDFPRLTVEIAGEFVENDVYTLEFDESLEGEETAEATGEATADPEATAETVETDADPEAVVDVTTEPVRDASPDSTADPEVEEATIDPPGEDKGDAPKGAVPPPTENSD